ncbi:hypothetical protein niasHS_003834 [Heterodera schachtii]|uniref:C2H2-type domain-containing protein n=2 Tax=Heterodera TaxID=34509 RepID=A0ABD2K3A8_HETSC
MPLWPAASDGDHSSFPSHKALACDGLMLPPSPPVAVGGDRRAGRRRDVLTALAIGMAHNLSDLTIPSISNNHFLNCFATISPAYPSNSSNSSPCCAFLCAHCPSASFPNMEELEQHQQHNHQHQQNNSRMKEQQNDSGEAKLPVQLVKSESTSPPPLNSPTASSSSSSCSVSDSMGQLIVSPSGIALAALTCKKCPGGRTFASQEMLNIHYIKTHRDRPQYACVKCGQSFSIKRELSTHHRIHSGEQPHKCLQCGKEFGTRQLLKKHSMWHIGKRSHTCPHCGKSFFQKGHLTQHLMIHSGDRPHQCELCDKTFIFKFDLNRHLKIHQERKFACKKCGKCFGEQTALEEHRTRDGKCGGGKAAAKGGAKRRGSSSSSSSSSVFGPTADNEQTTASKSTFPSENEAQNEGEKVERDEEELMPSKSVSLPVAPPPNSLCPPTPFDHLQQQQQQQLAIGRLFGQLLATRQSIATSSDHFFPCLLCPQRFCTQAAYLLHWGASHMRGGTVPAQQQQMVPKEDTAGQILHHSDTSCASSPQKASPPFSANPFDVPSSAHFFFPSVCANCELERRRVTQCARELADARAELHRLRALLLRVGAIFGVSNGAGSGGLNGAETFLGTQG